MVYIGMNKVSYGGKGGGGGEGLFSENNKIIMTGNILWR